MTTGVGAHEAEYDPLHPDHPRCGVCGRWINRDLDGAWEHTAAVIARPVALATVTPADLPRLFPCDQPIPHPPHRRDITDGDLIGGYRCDGNGGIVLPDPDSETHFDGCPRPIGWVYYCDYCQGIAAGRSGT